MNNNEILQSLRLWAKSEKEYQSRRIAEADAMAREQERELENRVSEFELYEAKKAIYFQERATIKFSYHIPELNTNVYIISNGIVYNYIYWKNKTYFIEIMGQDRFTWCDLDKREHARPSLNVIHDYSECSGEKQMVFMKAVGLYVRAALHNTKKMGNYNKRKCEELLELANRNFSKIGMEIKVGADLTIINGSDKDFLWREFCKMYMNSK